MKKVKVKSKAKGKRRKQGKGEKEGFMADKKHDLVERTYAFSKRIIFFLEEVSRDYISQTLGKQLLRSATSIGANVMEAQAAPTKKDFANFYNHSLKSANESGYWLRLIGDCGKGPEEKVKLLANEAGELAKILASILIKVRSGIKKT